MLEPTEDTLPTPHAAGSQSAMEALPGSVLGGMVTGVIYYGSSWTSHPMDAGTAASIGAGLVAIGSMLSSYWMARHTLRRILAIQKNTI